jgi:RNA methyltransferase, TrmH family
VTVTSGRQHAIVRLFRQVARGEPERALIDGWHLLREAVSAGLTIESVALVGTPDDEPDRALIHRLSHAVTVSRVTESVMTALTPVRTPSGVAAIVRKREFELSDALASASPLVVVAVGLQDPGNAGAVIRSAEAGGATGVVLAGESADPWSWKALRAAMGSTFRLPVIRQSDSLALCDRLRNAGLRLLASDPRGGVTLHEADLRTGTALLLGGEGAGLPPDVVAKSDGRVSIPMNPHVESLNVAVAAGVLVYEARRQRHQLDPG